MVPLYAMLMRSPSARSASVNASVCFSIGCDSPVSAASSIRSCADVGEAQVGRDHAARLEQHEVARHEIGRRHRHDRAVANHASLQCCELLQRPQRLLGAILLDEADDRIQHDDGEDGGGVLDLADESGDDRRGDQQDDHEIGELAEEHLAMGCAAPARESRSARGRRGAARLPQRSARRRRHCPVVPPFPLRR